MSSEAMSEVKNTNGGGYVSSSDEEETKTGTEGFRKDGEPEYKPRKASSSSDSDSSADGADDVEEDSSSESRVAQKRSVKSESSEGAGGAKVRSHSSSSDTDDNQDDITEDEDEEMKSKLEEDKKLDILNDNQELSKEEIELSKRQTIAIEDKEEMAQMKEVVDSPSEEKAVSPLQKSPSPLDDKNDRIQELNYNVAQEESVINSDEGISSPALEMKKSISVSSHDEEEQIIHNQSSAEVRQDSVSSLTEDKPEIIESPVHMKKKSLSSSSEEEELIGAPDSPKKLVSSSSEDEFAHHKKVSDDEEIQMKDSSSSEDDFVHIEEKDVMKSPSTASEDSIKESPIFVDNESKPVEEVKIPSLPEPTPEVSRSVAPSNSEKVVLRAETPERVLTSPKPPTSPKPSHIPRVNNNGDITKIYTEALTNDSENNNKNPAPKAGIPNRSKPSRDITEIYKNSILAKEATPPSSPRTPRNKPAKDITSLYTDKIEKPSLTSPSEKLCPKKHNMATSVEKDEIRRAYEDVRSDTSDTDWAVFKFEGNKLGVTATGNDFNEFKSCFGNEDRGFGYIRIMTGDEMSKRSKFVLVTWVGPQVSVMKKAKMSTDKALMKDVIQNLSVELQLESHFEFNHDHFKHEVDRASGARYGTGVRDL